MIIIDKKIVISILLVVCLSFIALIIVRSSAAPQIDNPIVLGSNFQISTVKSDFLYSDFLKRKHNFHTDINFDLLKAKPMVVSSNDELKINFIKEPENFGVFRQLRNGNLEKIFDSIEDGKDISNFKTPNTPGIYVFSISASYKEGVGIYYFSVEVVE